MQMSVVQRQLQVKFSFLFFMIIELLGMASARGWDEMIQPAVILGCLGYTSANFLGMLISYVLQLI